MKALSAEAIKSTQYFKPLELPITFWAFATLALDDERLLRKAYVMPISVCSSLQMLDLSNTGWALALLGKTREPLLESISAQGGILLGEASFQSHLGNPLALIWAFWRLHQEHLEPKMFRQYADLGILIELVSCGVILMGNDWRKLRPVEVNIEEAMEVSSERKGEGR